MLNGKLLDWHSPKDFEEANEPMGTEESGWPNKVNLKDVGDGPTVMIDRDNDDL